MFDLHRHDEFSQFDGFGNALDLATYAKELGHTAICTTNHGNTSSMIKTYKAGHLVGIKPILGVEGYFLPKWKEKTRGFHLLLIAKDFKGYGNINRLQYYGDKQRYYNPIWDFKLLRKYHDGVICTTACVASYTSQAIIRGKPQLAEKALVELQQIFGDDLYVEIQPYAISDPGVQEKVNMEMLRLANLLGIKCILTSDSHRGRPEDFDSYLKMHEIANHDLDMIRETYEERYMPAKKELGQRFIKMHKGDLGIKEAKRLATEMYKNLDEIDAKCDGDYLDDIPIDLPKLTTKGMSSTQMLRKRVKEGLKKRGHYNKEYLRRCKQELEVIEYHGFEDYFLIVADYVVWAKEQGMAVGPGRGSVCNSLVAYALYITEVDSLHFDLDFRRFLRKDKKSYPDIDLDFPASRRNEVIKYITDKYMGHSARICSYGLYKVDNLLNDLVKVSNYWIEDPDTGKEVLDKREVAYMKKHVHSCMDGYDVRVDDLLNSPKGREINEQHDNILYHFTKLYKKVRFIGTHAAGVAITGGNLLDYVAVRTDKSGELYTAYDLTDLDNEHVIKFDILGLRTMDILQELREMTGETPDYERYESDPKIMEQFGLGNTDGVFQFETDGSRGVLREIAADSFADVVAASSMNRPGPLSLHMPAMYAENKQNIDNVKQSKYYKYTKDSYGTVIYQEQILRICTEIGKMDWVDADRVLKFQKGNAITAIEYNKGIETRNELTNKFVTGAMENGYTKEEANELFDCLLYYTFNKGHATGYSLISIEEMFYKVYYPNEYWYVKLKYARDENEYAKFSAKAVKDGSVIFLPHINYSLAKTSMRKVEGQRIIQEGLTNIKGVGEKAAEAIAQERMANGIFRNFDDFYDRCKGRVVNKRVIDLLVDSGATDMRKKRYIRKTTLYNQALYGRADRYRN